MAEVLQVGGQPRPPAMCSSEMDYSHWRSCNSWERWRRSWRWPRRGKLTSLGCVPSIS